jgi:hypothetical protein
LVLINTCSGTLSTPMSETEVDALVSVFGSGFDELAKLE